MIGYIKGTVADLKNNPVLILVQEGALGYQVHLPQRLIDYQLKKNQTIELYIYTHVREDALDLFGFQSIDEKEFFLTLLQVSGLGPKTALSLLSKTEPEQLLSWIRNKDKEAICKLPGVGKKTAERMILDLSEKVEKKIKLGLFSTFINQGSVSVSDFRKNGIQKNDDFAQTSYYVDAKEGLIDLGFKDSHAQLLLSKIIETNVSKQWTAEELIRSVLKNNQNSL